MVNCELKFDNNPNGIYYSGQTLSGVVEFYNEKTRKIRGVSLRIEGLAKCKWTESEGSGKHRRTIQYSGREDYMDTFSYLVGSHNVSDTELAVGQHKFNFACVLPPQLPTSFESKYGYIRYQIKVEMERPWKIDLKYCFAFTVIKVHDLNYESPALRSPLKVEAKKTFFLGLSSKALFMSAEMPISGFVAGQNAPISISINNESNIEVEEVVITLKKLIHYNSQTPRRRTKERIESAAEVRHAGVGSKSKGNVEAQFTVPPVPPTNIAFCKVLQVSYYIHITARMGGIHRSAVLRMPITIGTVPLHNQQYASAPVSISNWNAQASTSNAPPSAPLLPYPTQAQPSAPSADFGLPSYHEAMGMSSTEVDDDGLNDEKPFSPMYPVFNFAAPIQPAQQSSELPPAYGFSGQAYDYPQKQGF